MNVNKDQVKGRVEEAKGKIKEVAGKLVGNNNKHLEARGRIQGIVGEAQVILGDVKHDLKESKKHF